MLIRCQVHQRDCAKLLYHVVTFNDFVQFAKNNTLKQILYKCSCIMKYIFTTFKRFQEDILASSLQYSSYL